MEDGISGAMEAEPMKIFDRREPLKITNPEIQRIAIEKALNTTLLPDQDQYIFHDNDWLMSRGAGAGKTYAHCIKLAISEGEPLRLREEFSSDYDIEMFIELWQKLKDAGIVVRRICW